MPKFTPAQKAEIRAQATTSTATSLSSALRATLATAAQGVKAEQALAGVADLAATVASLEAATQVEVTMARYELRLPAGTPGGVLAAVTP
jgi:hypothetical protein